MMMVRIVCSGYNKGSSCPDEYDNNYEYDDAYDKEHE